MVEEDKMKVPPKLRRHVSEANLDAIAKAVDEAEASTSAEIVVHIVRSLLPLEKPRARARRAFLRLGVHRTEKRNGVLLFVAMKKRCFEIVADEGADREIDRTVWKEIAEEIERTIHRDGFEKGICRGVSRIGAKLSERFPRSPRDVNELPDRPTVG
jgi:uncharacterized membrane protein